MQNKKEMKLKKIPSWKSIKWLGSIHAHKSLDEWLVSMERDGKRITSIRSVYGRDEPFMLIQAGTKEEEFENQLIVMSMKIWLERQKHEK